MERSENRVERIGIRYGLWVSVGLIVFFLLMKLIGLVHIVELRALNIFILAAGVITAIRELKNTSPRRHLSYLKGFGLGLMTTAIGVVVFSLFLFFYLAALDPGFMLNLQQTERLGSYLNPYTVAILIIIEGGFSGVILSLATMQYMKHSYLKASRMPRQEESQLRRHRVENAV